ncbi:polysaccharide transporter, PST family [Alteribacillus persepolensis]|uniref:Polysaccharide transporter, PST family n=1 Tax=Alteribacillus persepolensis TaxID=568899 RepID=A0A1G8HZU6_9BACI|nr:polysaccharide biosynthesis protein [Alteribacillus persepolensis]SDI12199.1 polysaccharide transporter, PST family [Alteribacillus persepolensis]
MSTSYIKNKTLWKGAFLVSGAAFLGKILSALYRVPFQNITGDLGYYVYQQIYPFYGAAMVISMYGFPVVISKVVMEQTEKGDGEKRAVETAFASLFLLLIVFVPLFLLIFIQAEPIALAMGDVQLKRAIQVVSVVFLFIPVYSAARGYFQGIGLMTPTAVSHTIEQCLRVLVILGLASFVVHTGQSEYRAGESAAIGSIAGSAAGILYLMLSVWRDGAVSRGNIRWSHIFTMMKQINVLLLTRGFFVCAGAMIFILYQWVDAFTIAPLLEQHGMTEEEARTAKGVFDRGQPLLQFGTVIATSFAMAVVPLITRAKQQRNNSASHWYAALSIRVSVLIGAAAAVGLFITAEFVNVMLFENTAGTEFLRILAVTLAASGVVMASSAVMQGHDCFYIPVMHLMLGLVIKTGANIYLIPVFHEKGAAFATVIGMVITALCNMAYLYKKKWVEAFSWRWLWKAFFAVVLMAALALLLIETFSSLFPLTRMWAAVGALSTAVTASVFFVWLLIVCSVLTKEERALLPAMGRIEQIIRRKE